MDLAVGSIGWLAAPAQIHLIDGRYLQRGTLARVFGSSPAASPSLPAGNGVVSSDAAAWH
jgi:hypothetical protein